MASAWGSIVERLRQPAYTGENRCLPCTAVNLGIAVALAALAAVVAVTLGVAVLGVSLLAIYFRGYLVPGTPALTQRVLPDRILRAFGKDPATAVAWDPEDLDVIQELEAERENRVRPDEFLLDVGAVVPSEADDRRRLAEDFAAAIDERLADQIVDPVDAEVLAELFDAEPSAVAELDRDYPAYEVGIRIRKWPSAPAMHLDLATNEAFATWTDRWPDVPLSQRVDILRSLRTLREDCPACGGDLRQSEETLDSCCHSAEMVVVACADCGERLLEADPDTAELPQPSGL